MIGRCYYFYGFLRVDQRWFLQTKIVRNQRVELVRFVQELRLSPVIVNELQQISRLYSFIATFNDVTLKIRKMLTHLLNLLEHTECSFNLFS